MKKVLREYQARAVTECMDALISSNQPVLLYASVGSGKSLMIATILLKMENLGKRALCLVNNSELVRSNAATYIDQGGSCSIFCAALKQKDYNAPIIFGSPLSIVNQLTDEIGRINFNLIVVDEGHAIPYLNRSSAFMRILLHYQQKNPTLRILGASGTNFRFKGSSIVGEECLFKKQVGNITVEELIDKKYLVSPSFTIAQDSMDFSIVKKNKEGTFKVKELEKVVKKSTKVTQVICEQLINIMTTEKRLGVFVFASTRLHALEIMSHLPPNESELILGYTPHYDRARILNKARAGKIKYLVNISVISVGVDVPAFDTIAYLRPTESLVLLVQTMGRGLRLSPLTNKKDCKILDFAGNIERHQDWDNPIILNALKDTIHKDLPYEIKCPKCYVMNTSSSRRCIGVNNNERCTYFFTWKECVKCKSPNDIAARFCRICNAEIVDPNSKLNTRILDRGFLLFVSKSSYTIRGTDNNFVVRVHYKCFNEYNCVQYISETYYCNSDKSRNYFYGAFICKHFHKKDRIYHTLNKKEAVANLMNENVHFPIKIYVTMSLTSPKIKEKVFDESFIL